MSILVILEVGKKQDYIFRSNKLQEIVGASMIIRHVSEELPRRWIRDDRQIMLEGGGHSIYAFGDEAEGRRFIGEFSLEVLRRFPGLELAVASVPYDPDKDLLPDSIDRLFEALNDKKSKGLPPRQLSFGIEERCQSTQLPASRYHERYERRAVSSEIWAKLQFVADKSTKDYFSDLKVPGVSDNMAKQMDELEDHRGKTAVVHMDGNRMGAKLQAFRRYCVPQPGETVAAFNERYRQEFRQFSRDIDQRYKAAFRHMMQDLTDWVRSDNSTVLDRYRQGIPYRPIIFAGDDISFIMPGALGVEAARIMLEKLEQNPMVIGGETHRMHACAGIAIVRSGFPFARAHDLAEQLCAAAKTRVLSDQEAGRLSDRDGTALDASAFDFHILQGDWSGSLHQWRRREYQGIDRDGVYRLTMKPLYLTGSRIGYENLYGWDDFVETVTCVTNGDLARSKIKGLRSSLKRGPLESRRYVMEHGLAKALGTLPNIPIAEGEMFTATDRVCPYYDAIEAMDNVLVIGISNGKGGVQA